LIIGYMRTSTVDQAAGLEAQRRDLMAAGVEKLFTEQASLVGARPVLAEALGFVREGDVFVVTKIDRLARSIVNLCEIVTRIEKRKASLRVLAMNLDTGTPTGKLILNVVGSIAEFEREMMLERQREGIAKAQAEGRYKVRPKSASLLASEARQMVAGGKTVTEARRSASPAQASTGRWRPRRAIKRQREAALRRWRQSLHGSIQTARCRSERLQRG
jgi:DNA invertase Pin-like site-specific DNA recombinase